MPKDEFNLPVTTQARSQPGLVPRFLSWLFATGSGPARSTMHRTHEELFRMRGELATLRAEMEALQAAVGRRDIATLDELLRGGNRRQVEALIRDRTQTVPLPDGSVLCRALGRFKMFTDAADGGIAPHLLLDGYWEYWVTEFVCRNVARGEIAVDVGAVYGYYTILLADLVGSEGRVHALEPNPWLHWLLLRNVVVNGLEPIVEVRGVAAMDAARDAVRIPALLTGPPLGPFADRFSIEDGGQGFAAPAAPLQDLVPEGVGFLRIGCAATADAIVAGIPRMIERNPQMRILLEFDANRCRDAAAMLAALAAHYPLRFVDGDSRAKPCTIDELLGSRRLATLYLSKMEPC